MTTLNININFQNIKEPLKLYVGMWTESISRHWGLKTSHLSHFDYKWMFLDAHLKISKDEFLKLVGHNEKEAIELISKRHPSLDYQEAKDKYISPEVIEFYNLAQKNEIESVEIKITDQS